MNIATLTTQARIDLLARAYPRLFPRAELVRLMRDQLGNAAALDRWMVRDGVRVRARGPRMIHHVCAGNLAISAMTSIAHGLILGSRNTVQLPGAREDGTTRREVAAFVRGLPRPLRGFVTLLPGRDEAAFAAAEVVIAFGGDATMTELRAKVRGDQRFIAHGHAVSLLWIGEPEGLTAREARACAVDVLTYDQLGCLSPQGIYLPPRADVAALGGKLARALEAVWRAQPKKPARPLGTRARIAEARDAAFALGHACWLPPSRHLGWTLIHDPEPTFSPSPLHGVIYLRVCPATKLTAHLAPVRGKISTVGLVGGENDEQARAAFTALGVSRFCPAGRMQSPPLAWHHDGRAVLTDLVRWTDDETRP
jgi:hypothetical protein